MAGRHAAPSNFKPRRVAVGNSTAGSSPVPTGSSPSGKGRLIAAALGILALIVVAGLIIWALVPNLRSKSDEAAVCPDKPVVVVASAAVGGALTKAAQAKGCNNFDVRIQQNSSFPDALNNEKADLWIADSSQFGRQTMATLKRPYRPISDSIAKSPLVVAGNKLPDLPNWAAALSISPLHVGEPRVNPATTAALDALNSEVSDGHVKPEDGSKIQSAALDASEKTPIASDNDLLQLADKDGAAIVSERSAIEARKVFPQLQMKVPTDGTRMLDFPLIQVTDGEAVTKAGQAAAAYLASPEGQKALAEQNLRKPNGDVINGGVGPAPILGAPASVVPTTRPSSEQTPATASTSPSTAIPERMIVLIDTSGSMGFAADGSTRIDYVEKAFVDGNKKFSGNSEVGVWTFNSRTYREVVPVRREDAKVDGKTQRDVLDATVNGLSSTVYGGTPLYSATLAAYQQAVKDWSPDHVNRIVLMTDGSNDGAGTLRGLLDGIKSVADPAKPVQIITVGVTKDADTATLKKIAAATSGASFTIDDPAQVEGLFRKIESVPAPKK